MVIVWQLGAAKHTCGRLCRDWLNFWKQALCGYHISRSVPLLTIQLSQTIFHYFIFLARDGYRRKELCLVLVAPFRHITLQQLATRTL